MDGRSLSGLIVFLFGFILLGVGALFGGEGILFIGFYSLVIIVIGLVIIFNKKEDKIEEINYSKIKGGTLK
jgi:lipoprotein signal peptidase